MLVLPIACRTIVGVQLKLGGVVPCEGSVFIELKIVEIVVIVIHGDPGLMGPDVFPANSRRWNNHVKRSHKVRDANIGFSASLPDGCVTKSVRRVFGIR